MANNAQQQYQQPPTTTTTSQQAQPGNSSPHHCKECGLYLNSAESLEVHLQYHKENLLNKWATQASASGAPHSDEANNNNNNGTPPASGVGNNKPPLVVIKREFASAIAAAADSSDVLLKKSPEYGSRTTPEINVSFGHPPTPQSYHSASSPYQTPDNSAFSPGFQGNNQQQHQPSSYQSFQETTAGFYGMDAYSALQQQKQQQQQEYAVKMSHQGYRYHPYQQHAPHQVSSSSPAYPPQPTPSPSPKQCDKCGYVCESAAQLIDHLNVAHPSTPAPHLGAGYQQNHFIFGANSEVTIKQEVVDDVQSDILDLDSHKVVHQVYPDEVDKRVGQVGDMNGHNPHSVSAMLDPWPQQQGAPPPPPQQQQHQQQAKLFAEGFSPHKFHSQVPGQPQHEFNPGMLDEHAAYRPFEHMPPQGAVPPVISSTQVPSNPVQAPPTNGKGPNWKSNEARRPKTYNCTACNKWFTSSGHLKRHYNTTLHKNAVKSSGQPDPATMPISVHHHPTRESAASREEQQANSSPGDDSRSEDSMSSSFERPGVMPALLQQPPAGPYDRQPAPNIAHPHPHPLHHPLHPHPASPPNGEAGLSATTTNIDSRGLLSISNSSPVSSNHHPHHNHHLQHSSSTTTNSSSSSSSSNNSSSHGFSHIPPPGHHHMMAAATMNNPFQMYPNECAPHATQATAATTINSLSTTGEEQQQQTIAFHQPPQPQAVFAVTAPTGSPGASQPLPSFAQFNNGYGLLLGYTNGASVGGPGPVTVPYSTATNTTTTTFYAIGSSQPTAAAAPDTEFKLAVLTPVPVQTVAVADASTLVVDAVAAVEEVPDVRYEAQPASPEKARTKRDYEESTGSPRITSTSGTTAIWQISKDGVHKCIDCDKVFMKSCYLTQHNKTFHSGDKPFKCSRCGKRFSDEGQYTEHLAKHAGDKPFKCELCPKQFNHKTDLRRHMCLHTGQKPYSCEICHKGFIRKDHMLKHCETHARKPHNGRKEHQLRTKAAPMRA